MIFLPVTQNGDLVFIDAKKAIERGKELSAQYQAAHPFAHCVIENFLPAEITERLLREFPVITDRETKRSQEIFKGLCLPDQLPDSAAFARGLFYSFNSEPFLGFLEALTGIKGLIPDPHFLGGGFHETLSGGRLGIHADFNIHQKLRLRRRINVLVYLNHDWKPEWGGELELWTQDMKTKAKSVAPHFNRCVIFDTNDTSWHGHPDAMTCPVDRSRKSLALYYYTASDAIFAESKVDTTNFRVRSGSGDKADLFMRTKYLVRDLIPPLFLRALLWMKRSLRP
jgi:hypothetical protein